MVPQNNYTLKHNSLTTSSSWRGANWLLVYGKYECAPYYSSKPKANEKWRFENSHCGGPAVLTTPSDKVCLSSFFYRTISEKMKCWNSNPEIANAGAPQTTSTFSPSMCVSLPAFSSVLPWSSTISCSGTPPGFSLPICTTIVSSGAHGGWWKWQNEFWQNLQLTHCLHQIKWSPHAGSHSSQTFHGITKFDNQLVDSHTLVIYYSLILIWWNCLPAITSTWYFKDRLRNETKKFLISIPCCLWLAYKLTP